MSPRIDAAVTAFFLIALLAHLGYLTWHYVTGH